MSKRLIVILGPTAVGKTSLSISLAHCLNTEILSADSRQFYRDIQIGTARPTEDEMRGVRHHFLGFLPMDADYTAGQFEKDCLERCTALFEKYDDLILTGGSGLFIKAVCDGLDELPRNLELRSTLNLRFEKEGLAPLRDELIKLDPESALRLDLENHQRVIRALEVSMISGRPFTSFHTGKKKTRPFEIVYIGLRRDRAELYERIERRCDIMLASGWVEECQSVVEYRGQNSLNTVGYKEIFEMLDGKLDEAECAALIKQRTRNFAKRQMTWFKKIERVHWVDLPKENAVDHLMEIL